MKITHHFVLDQQNYPNQVKDFISTILQQRLQTIKLDIDSIPEGNQPTAIDIGNGEQFYEFSKYDVNNDVTNIMFVAYFQETEHTMEKEKHKDGKQTETHKKEMEKPAPKKTETPKDAMRNHTVKGKC